ncbi:CYTH and CHAD domain-containing protein [Aquisediminimonas sediminicola]|uniref:CYTH and CHAD domain-containing protein n=1 Tax=Alteraquisediminimonas sediminicola TaxID=2676787 RepID=UPI001C8D8D46|nr:CYTH and CHAD domain-containing protein [Aquisediminimonas sediminicola]
MSIEREIEIKLILPDGDPAPLLALAPFRRAPRILHFHTRYYDTPDWSLSRARAILRIRCSGDQIIQCVKMPASNARPTDRAEWERPLESDQLALELLPPSPRHRLEQLINDQPLRPFATLEVTRRIWIVAHRGSQIEMALDSGTINANGQQVQIAELELELVDGRVDDMIDFALGLPLGPGLAWSMCSKGARAHMTARGLHPAAIKASPVTLSPHLTSAQAFQEIAWHCLGHLLGNYRLVIDMGDADALHQSRVAIRRMRAACSLFSSMLNDAPSRLIRAELRAAASALGPARDLDVLIARIHEDIGAVADYAPLMAQLEQQRRAAYEHATALLNCASFQRLLFQLAAWIENGAWLNGLKAIDSVEQDLPVPIASPNLASTCAHELQSRYRKVKKAGQHFQQLDAPGRHQLRIEIKKLRYAADFFGSLFPGSAQCDEQRKPHQAFVDALTRLQDLLGELNDLATGREIDVGAMDSINEIEQARLTLMLDQALRTSGRTEKQLINDATHDLDQALHLPRFWRDQA